jgi:hypothetical protein
MAGREQVGRGRPGPPRGPVIEAREAKPAGDPAGENKRLERLAQDDRQEDGPEDGVDDRHADSAEGHGCFIAAA